MSCFLPTTVSPGPRGLRGGVETWMSLSFLASLSWGSLSLSSVTLDHPHQWSPDGKGSSQLSSRAPLNARETHPSRWHPPGRVQAVPAAAVYISAMPLKKDRPGGRSRPPSRQPTRKQTPLSPSCGHPHSQLVAPLTWLCCEGEVEHHLSFPFREGWETPHRTYDSCDFSFKRLIFG